MFDHNSLSQIVLLTTSAILIYAAIIDLKYYKISNSVILIVALLFFVDALVQRQLAGAAANVGFSTLIFVMLLAFYRLGWMGGGDVKLLTVAFLWVGIHLALPFAILLLLFSAIHAFSGMLGMAKVQRDCGNSRMKIPLAPSVAGALIVVFAIRMAC